MTALTERPARLLLRLHLRRLNGQLRLSGRGLDARIWIKGGVLWAATGVPGLFDSLRDRVSPGIPLGQDLLQGISPLMAQGLDLNTIMDHAGTGVGRLLAQASLDPELQAEFEAEVAPPPGAFGGSTPLLRDFALALRELQSAGEVADLLSGWSSARIKVEQASGEDLSPLGPIAVRTLALAQRNRILGDLVRNSGRGQLKRTQEAWLAVNLLLQLGLVRIPQAPPVEKAATLEGLAPPGKHIEAPAPLPPPPPAARPEPLRPPPSRRRTRSQARPSGLAAFAASAGEAQPQVEIEEQVGGWSGVTEGASESFGGPTQPIGSFEDDVATGPIPRGLGEDDATGPLDTAASFLEETELEGTGEVFAMGDEDDEEVFAMGDEDDEEVFPMGEEDEDEDDEVFAMGDEDEEVFAMGDDEEEEEEDDDDSSVEAFSLAGEEPTPVFAMDEDEDEDLAEPSEDFDDEDGFSLDGEPIEDPALPGLRRRLETLRGQTQLEQLGVGRRTLLSRNLKRSELEFCWQTARAPWLPANWRSASPGVQQVVGEIRGLLDGSFKELSAPAAYAEALSSAWLALPQQQNAAAEALVQRAQRECAAARWDRALVVLKKVRETNPTHARAVLLQVYAQVVQGRIPAEDAVAWVYAVSQRQSDLKLRAQGAYTAGRLMERLKRPADALICYRAAAAWKPDHSPSAKRIRVLREQKLGDPTGLGRCFDPSAERPGA